MSQIDIDDAIDNVTFKRNTEKSQLRGLESEQWLKESQPIEYRRRKQTHEAWVEICELTLNWLWKLKGSQDTVSERKFLNRKRQDLKEVYESGDYPYADIPEPMPLID